MKKLIQTRLNDPSKGLEGIGNCFPTVIACLMDKDSPEDVIQIQMLYDMSEHKIQWDLILDMWLNRLGWEWFRVDSHNDIEKDQYYLVTGNTHRSKTTTHVCIYKNGKLFHDPHPDQSGLTKERFIEVIRKIK